MDLIIISRKYFFSGVPTGSLFLRAVLFAFLAVSCQMAYSHGVEELICERDTINNPRMVRADRDGSLHLDAEVGKAVGPRIEYMPEWKAFGWFTADDRVEWEVRVPKDGVYEVYLEWSVSDKEAGKPFAFQAGDKTLQGVVASTGSWEKFDTIKIGTIALSRGKQKMVFRPTTRFEKGGALLDLRKIKLVLTKSQ